MRRAFISPSKYVQGKNELENLGYFVESFGKVALLIANSDDIKRVKTQLDYTANKFDISFVESDFAGDCTHVEINRLKQLGNYDCVIGLGGGKAIDTAKCVSDGKNLIVVPTIVSSDAPTSHCAVVYNEDKTFSKYLYLSQNPSVVLVDTTVISNAPTRFLVAGMGDAISTYFEARTSKFSNSYVDAGFACGKEAVATEAALAIAKLCYEIILRDGACAKISNENKQVSLELSNVVEANTLLSGLGFENGGLSIAHAVCNGFSLISDTHKFLHGEIVAFCTLVQLVFEDIYNTKYPDKIVADSTNYLKELLPFYYEVGLPITLEDIGLCDDVDLLMRVAKKACEKDSCIHSSHIPVSWEAIFNAIEVASTTGTLYKQDAINK
ncbi:MAG: glycerol dehydrogenase [Epulopiscium sp. Nele67-Bin005]|nr:MAG: glycerol dehydrogenase [Epulopiscium sp. Nele67-Bin005]